MRIRWILGLVLLALISAQAGASETERVSDRTLKSAFKSLDKNAAHFRSNLDRDLRNAIVRGPSGEVDMKRYLDDFDEAIERMNKRYSKKYAASAEALAVLHQGNELKKFVASRPGVKGEAEWQLLDADLARLASAYTASWPLEADATARRIGDGEFLGALDSLNYGIHNLSRAVSKQLKKLPEADRPAAENLVREAGLALDLVKPLKTRLNSDKPALAEARILLDKVSAIDAAAASLPLDEKTRNGWQTATRAGSKFAQGFGIQWPAAVAQTAAES